MIGVASEAAPAKINLYLHVTGRRADGYHSIDSLFVFTDIGDRLAAAPAPQVSLTVDGPFAAALEAAGGENLVLGAARALAARIGLTERLAFQLTKNLPVAAGMGGGSSDAAAALRLVARLSGQDISSDILAAIGAELGADIPACIGARPVHVSGFGERLAPLSGEAPPLAMVLANPGRPLSTGAVFQSLGAVATPSDPLVAWPKDWEALIDALARRRNDLEAPARVLVPEIGEVLASLGALPGCRLARLSGSGPTCFGLFDGSAAAAAGAATLSTSHPDWWVAACRAV